MPVANVRRRGVGSPEPSAVIAREGPVVCFAIINEGDKEWLT